MSVDLEETTDPSQLRVTTLSSTTDASLPSAVRLARLDDAAAVAEIYNEGIEDRLATSEVDAVSVEGIGRCSASGNQAIRQSWWRRVGRLAPSPGLLLMDQEHATEESPNTPFPYGAVREDEAAAAKR